MKQRSAKKSAEDGKRDLKENVTVKAGDPGGSTGYSAF